MLIKKLFLGAILFLSFFVAQSQCPSCDAVPPCSGGNGPVYNNANINSGDTYWYDGSGDTYNINFGGGTLIVCGDLTISNLNFNGSSKIYVASGGKLTINSNVFLNGGARIYNYGELIINGDVTLQNPDNLFSNCSEASLLTISGKLTINNSTSYFVNRGKADINNITMQANGSNVVCLGQGSETNFSDLTNNYTYSVTAPEGQACLSYSGNALLNNDLTADADVIVCKKTGATTSGGAGFGNATVYENCTSCSQALPIELLYFTAIKEKRYVKLTWETQTEINNDYFIIQRSKNGYDFEDIGKVDGAGNSALPVQYVYYDKHPYQGFSYYRLKQVDFNGDFSFSNIEDVYFETIEILDIYPNPADNHITIEVGAPENIEVYTQITNSIGQLVLQNEIFVNSGKHYIKLDISAFPSGIYVFKIITPDGELAEKEFIKR